MAKKKWIDVKEYDYESWEKIFFSDKHQFIFPNMCFPNEVVKKRYLLEAKNKSDYEIRDILRKFLVKTGRFGADEIVLEGLQNTFSEDKLQILRDKSEHYNRLFSKVQPTWEGITWVLDLLPHFPKEALRAVSSYFLAHCQFFPDYVFSGVSDCEDIIRAKYFDIEHPQEILLGIDPEEFEWLVEELYIKMGYQAMVSKKGRDKGIDIIIEKSTAGKKEISIIQCKRKKDKVGSPIIHELGGVVANKKATKGILVCASDFTSDAKKYAADNPSIELINFKELTKLLNIHLSPDWPISMKNIFLKKRGQKVEIKSFWELLDDVEENENISDRDSFLK